MAPLNKKNVVVKKLDDVPNNIVDREIDQPESKIAIDHTNYRPKISVYDRTTNLYKKYTNIPNHSNRGDVSNSHRLTLCTYTPSNDFVYQNDRPTEPSGSNQTMDYMSSKFLNDNLYQASFFTFSPEKNRIVYTDHPTKNH
jgi:hypothetical protein